MPDTEAGLSVDAGALAAPRYFQSLADQVWAVQSPAVLRELAEIAQRGVSVEAAQRRRGQRAEDAFRVRVRDGVAIVPIIGPIFPRANLFTEVSGGTSLEVAQLDLQRMLERTDIKAVLLNVDSPGGVVTDVDETAQMIAEIARQKPVTAYVGGVAASAAYWLASAAREIVVTRTGQVGSIGVVATVPKQQQPDGAGIVDFEIVSSNAPEKRPDPETEAGRAAILSRIDPIERLFVDTVAEGRGVSRQTVLREFGRGNLLTGQDAVDVGMADRVGTFEDVLAELAARQSPDQGVAASAAARDHSQQEESMADDPTTTAEASNSAETQPAATPAPEPAAQPQPAAVDPAQVVEMCNAAGVPDLAAGLIREKATADQVRARISNAGEIRGLCRAESTRRMVPAEKADAIADEAIKAGLSVEQVRAKLWDAAHASQTPDDAVQSRITPDTPGTATVNHNWDRAFAAACGGKVA